MEIKVLGISGSPRKGSNTDTLVKMALSAAKEIGGVSTEFISLSELEINPCSGCYSCYGFKKGATWEKFCYTHDDDAAFVYEKIRDCDGLIVGTPVYSYSITGKLKALMERGPMLCHYAASPISGSIRGKVVGGIVVAFERRGGQESALFAIWRWATTLLYSTVVGACPFPQDPPPQSSFLGGLVDTCDSVNPLGDEGFSIKTSRIKPPTSGLYNERSVRNIGRNVALWAKIVKYGISKLKEEEKKVFPPLPLVYFPKEAIKEGSYLDKVYKGEESPKDYHMVKMERR